ncbi:large ribosomal subunit protein uL15-like [Eurosta solidaginis]|uniref:large ribosomal subunit protein uL15-like n=1 Tax=Eurosta solidaginis TaxID=178769 RepID=UPI003530C9A7
MAKTMYSLNTHKQKLFKVRTPAYAAHAAAVGNNRAYAAAAAKVIGVKLYCTTTLFGFSIEIQVSNIRRKKTRNLYGYVSYGHRCIGKYCKHSGGRGYTGGLHHNRITFDKCHSGYYGKAGVGSLNLRRQHKFCPTINLDKSWSQVCADKFEELEQKKSKIASVIELVQFGFYKLLGRGHLPKQNVIVKAKYFSKKAEDKIKAAGRFCLLRV